MMLIAPFKVKPWPFCRDVGFLHRSRRPDLSLPLRWQAQTHRDHCSHRPLPPLRHTVIVGAWWQERTRRQKRRLAAAREEFDSQLDHTSVRSRASSLSPKAQYTNMTAVAFLPPPLDSSHRIPSPSSTTPTLTPSKTGPANAPPAAAPPPRMLPVLQVARLPSTPRDRTVSRSATKPSLSIRPNLVPRHSLLSAIEFRDVVQSLRREANADRSQEIFQSWDPERFLAAHHHHHHSPPPPPPPSHAIRSSQEHLGRSASQQRCFNQNRHRHNRVLSYRSWRGLQRRPRKERLHRLGRRRLTFGAHDSVQPASAPQTQRPPPRSMPPTSRILGGSICPVTP